MKTKRKQFRKRPYQPPKDKRSQSISLRQIDENIQRRKYSAGLSKANQILADASLSPPEQSRVLSLVADSEHKRGRFRKAAEIHLQAAAKSLSHPNLWLRPHIGQVGALLKVPDVEQAVTMARHAVELAEARMNTFDEQVRLANQELAISGSIVTPALSPRVSVVATRMGYLFLQEGEPEAAAEFFEKAIESSKGGANRARQGLAKIALAKGEFGKARRLSADAIRRGGFKVKTLSSWITLIAARRQLPGWRISDRLIKGLNSAPASLRARAILIIVRELRKSDMRQWREVAEEWLANEGTEFPIFEAEIRKLLLASAKTEPGNASDKRDKALQVLQVSGLSPNEWIAAAKERVRAGLWAGDNINLNRLLADARGRYGREFVPQARHSLALSCMMAKRHDLARPLLKRNIRKVNPTESVWGKSVWALARMESFLEDHATSAVFYGQFFEETSIPIRFRLQAQLLWCNEMIAAGQPEALLAARSLMDSTLSTVDDSTVLMNFARQLQFGPSELREWGYQLFDQGKAFALQRFHEAEIPSAAISILFKLTRRQVLDFGQYNDVIAFWEGMSPEKRDWLWSEKKDFWAYLGQVFEAYARAGNIQEAEAFARDYLADPASPPEELPSLGIPLARRLMMLNRTGESLELFEKMAGSAPTNSLCAEAWYWMALAAHKRGEADKVKQYAVHIRAAQGAQVGMLSEWNLDARAHLLLVNLDLGAVDPQAVNYTNSMLQEQLKEIGKDIARIS